MSYEYEGIGVLIRCCVSEYCYNNNINNRRIPYTSSNNYATGMSTR
jgi:hypothetical protein